MCGIIGVTSSNNVQDLIISSLRRLEYRGYDSSGLATISNNSLNICRAEGKINNLTNTIHSIYIYIYPPYIHLQSQCESIFYIYWTWTI